jgi:hypothetical protein
MSERAVYLYALVRSERRPSAAGAPDGLPGAARPRLLEAGPRLWLVVADAPLASYGEKAIERGLSNLDWVSRCAVAHQQVVRHFARRLTTLPMRLFTLFRGDRRAVEHVRAQARKLARVLARIEGCEEWGVRLLAEPAAPVPRGKAAPAGADAGRRFLERKRELHVSARAQAASAPRAAQTAFRKLARHARAERRLPVVSAGASRVLIDGALLVPREKRREFKDAVARTAREAKKGGVGLTLSGPWPAYNFADDGR